MSEAFTQGPLTCKKIVRLPHNIIHSDLQNNSEDNGMYCQNTIENIPIYSLLLSYPCT
jgi:hypothetical protein